MTEPADTPRRALIFEWKHRPVTWVRLSLFVFLALVAHVACFYLVSVRLPLPARAVPVPASIALASTLVNPVDEATGAPSLTVSAPLPTAGLGFPEMAVAERYEPSYQRHQLPRPIWPARPHRAAWPEITGASRMELPPPEPAPPQ